MWSVISPSQSPYNMQRVVGYSFNLNINVMKVVGLYPSDYHKTAYKVYSFVLYIFAMMPSTVFGILHFVFIEDVNNITYHDFIIIGMVIYTFKLLPFVTNGDRMKACIHYFDNPRYIVQKDEHRKIIAECIHTCRRNSRVFFAGYLAGLFGFIGQVLFQKNSQQLALNVWVPNIIKENTAFHFILHLLLIFGVIYVVLACGTIDPLIGGLAHQATAQLQVLKETLQYLQKYVDNFVFKSEYKNKLSNSDKIYLEIKKCVRRYYDIKGFVNEYQACFSPVVFSQFMGSGLVIAFCCFQLSNMSLTDINFLIMLNYIFDLFLQIFFYCYYGTMLIEESNTFATAIYMSDWYKYDDKCRKALIILMESSKKPMLVKAGKLFDLSLDTFTMILRRAYSLLAVLKNY